MTEAQAQARQRVQKAMLAVGPDFSGPLMDLCGFGRSVGEIEQALGLPQRSGKVLLSLGCGACPALWPLEHGGRGGPPAHTPLGTADSRPAFPKSA